MIKGIEIELGGEKYIVPSLTLDQVDELDASGALEKLPSNGPTYFAVKESRAALLDVAFAALSRNYPDLKKPELKGLIDLAAVEPLVEAVMSVTGLKGRAGAGEAGGP